MLNIHVFRGKVPIAGRILQTQGECLRQMSGGVHSPGEYIRTCTACRLTA